MAPALEKIDRRKKDAPRYTIEGEVAIIEVPHKMDGSIKLWRIPAPWLPNALSLWPVHVQKSHNGYYVSLKVPRKTYRGKKAQGQIAVHRVFVGAVKLDVKRRRLKSSQKEIIVKAKNGDFLDYTQGNLERVRVADVIPENN